MQSIKFCSLIFIVVASILTNCRTVKCAKILAIFPFAGPSQYILVQPYLKTLASRGHELTVVNAFPQKEKIKNFRDIPVLEVLNGYNDIIKSVGVAQSWSEGMQILGDYFNNVTLTVLENSEVQHLRSTATFDLIIIETIINDALFGFGQHFNAPLIGVSSYGTDGIMDELVGNTSPLSYIPYYLFDFTDQMTFGQRFKNIAYNVLHWLQYHYVQLPYQVELYKEYFPAAKIDLIDLRKNVSLMLLNQHFSLSFPRPYVPNMIEVGGFHINRKPAPLAKDMQAFIDSAPHGVIYFSMGTNVKSKDFSQDQLEILLKTFASLKQHVMWKFEDPDLSGKPENVFISKWFPQSDILAQPKVKLFITHGGLLSMTEAIYYGKPVVGIPIFFDQFLNVARIEKCGIGLGVKLKTITVAQLKHTIETVLYSPIYADKVGIMSKRYRDQPMTPMDTAIYWTEYVLRHNGAPHIRVAAQDLSFMEYHNLDIILVIFSSLSMLMFIVTWLCSKLILVVRNPMTATTNKKGKFE